MMAVRELKEISAVLPKEGLHVVAVEQAARRVSGARVVVQPHA